MLARRPTTILPVMTVAGALETTRIHRVAGLTGARTTLSYEASSLASDQPSSLVHAEAQLGIFTKSNVGNWVFDSGLAPSIWARNRSEPRWREPSHKEGEHYMFGPATLMVHRGAKLVTRRELQAIDPPPATATWKPVKHGRVMEMIHQELHCREISVVREEYAIQRDGHYLFAMMVLNCLKTQEFAAALAFRHSNDRKEAMKMYAGVSVFVCGSATRSTGK